MQSVKYDQFKVGKLKMFLEDMAAEGQPRQYEIHVNGLRVVPRTEDVQKFDNYERHIDEDTELVRVVIYNSAQSNRNEQFCFHVKNQKQTGETLGEIESIVQEKLDARDKEYKMIRIEEELATTKGKLIEAEDYIEQLQAQIEEEKGNRLKFKGMHIGEIASLVVEGMIRRNPRILHKLPYGEALAGLIEQDEKEKNQLADGTDHGGDATFQKKQDEDQAINAETAHYIPILQRLQVIFSPAQLNTVMEILSRFGEDPDSLKTVADLLNIQIQPS
jgi:hypothetical protein